MGRYRKSRQVNPLVLLLALPFLAFFACCGGCRLLPRSSADQQTTTSVESSIAPSSRPSVASEQPPATSRTTSSPSASGLSLSTDDPFESEPVTVKEPEPEYRTWTSADGKFKTVAFLVRSKGDFVQLQKQDGQRIAVPLTKLSTADIAFATGAHSRVQVLDGKVVGITDGDTLTLLDGANRQHKIRLEGIDAPEHRQDYGTQSRKALSSKVFGKYVRIEWADHDKYGRTLGHIYLDGRWVNKELVAEGRAWHYKKYSSDPELAAAEEDARAAKVGLWDDPNRPEAPWDFRANPRPAVRPLVSAPIGESLPVVEPRVAQPGQSTQSTERYGLNTSSNVRHNSSCRHFNNTTRGRFCGPNDGRGCGICGG